jgi:DNA-binding HxlR family transcriptional regulator
MKDSVKTQQEISYEHLIGCKWSKQLLWHIAEGTERPGALTRSIKGLTTKVQSECLRKMVRLGVVERQDFAEIPPRVEYKVTDTGLKLLEVYKSLQTLRGEDQEPASVVAEN